MAEPSDHECCPEVVRRGMAELGCEVTVSSSPPLVAGPYTTEPMRCPHGVLFWWEPTGEQIAEWVRDGVR